jgi:hypothetical protein
MGTVSATAAICVVLAAAGCADTRGPSAARVAEDFFAAIRQGQGQRACALLTPRTAEDVESCAQEILTMGLDGGAVRGTAVWGSQAQVRFAGDTVFLDRFPSGWRVRAAGCSPRAGLPYKCKVSP